LEAAVAEQKPKRKRQPPVAVVEPIPEAELTPKLKQKRTVVVRCLVTSRVRYGKIVLELVKDQFITVPKEIGEMLKKTNRAV
jgi:hypothetical protein